MDHLPLTRETIPNDLLNLCAFLQRCVGSPSFSAVGCNRGMYYDPGMGEPKFTMRVGSFGTLALRGSFFRTQAMLHDYQVRRQIDMPEVWSITSGRSILILEEIFQASGPLYPTLVRRLNLLLRTNDGLAVPLLKNVKGRLEHYKTKDPIPLDEWCPLFISGPANRVNNYVQN